MPWWALVMQVSLSNFCPCGELNPLTYASISNSNKTFIWVMDWRMCRPLFSEDGIEKEGDNEWAGSLRGSRQTIVDVETSRFLSVWRKRIIRHHFW